MAAGWAALQRAAKLVDLGRLREAEPLLRQILASDPADVGALIVLSMCLRGQRRFEEALQAAGQAVGAQPEHARAQAELARVLLALGRDDEALRAAREAVRCDPHLPAAVSVLADSAMHVSLPEAEQAAMFLQELMPHSALGHSQRARVEITRQRWAEAERWLREALRCDPLAAPNHANLALVLDQLGRREEARAEHQEAVRLDPQREVARHNLHIALRVDEIKGADAAGPYSSSLVGSTLSPASRARSLENVMHAALRSGRPDEARRAAAEARVLVEQLGEGDLEDSRTRVRVLAVVARVEHAADPAAEAAAVAELEADARKVLRPQELMVFLNNFGAALLRAGDDRSVGALEEVLRMTRRTGNSNGIGMALLNLGAANAGAGRSDAAERCYLEVRELALAEKHTARAVRAAINLAQVCLRTGRVSDAQRYVDEAMQLIETVDDPMLQAKTRVVAGAVALRRGDLVEAWRTLMPALWALHRGGDRGESEGWSYLAELALRRGRRGAARLHLKRAERRARSVQTRLTAAAARSLIEGDG